MAFPAESRTRRLHPGAAAVACGVAGLVGGFGGAWAGMRLAIAFIEPVGTIDPNNLFGNAILMIGPLLILGGGAMVGFVAGAAVTPLLLIGGLGWGRAARTFAFIALIDCVAIPLAVWLVVVADSSAVGSAALLVASVVVGGVVPGIARWLAVRPQG